MNNTGVEQLHKNLLTTKSSDSRSHMFSGHTSRLYNSTGRHLLLITCNVTFSDAILPNLSKTAFAARIERAFSNLQGKLENSRFRPNAVAICYIIVLFRRSGCLRKHQTVLL